MKTIFGIVFIIVALIIFGAIEYKEIQFGREIGGHMKRAATANTVDIAISEMQIVVDNMQARGYTHGYTSVIYTTPDEDVGFWYNNMVASLNELKKLPANATDLEKSNILMKLERTLESNGKETTMVVPFGISRFPDNLLWGILLTIAIFFLPLGVVMVLRLE